MKRLILVACACMLVWSVRAGTTADAILRGRDGGTITNGQPASTANGTFLKGGTAVVWMAASQFSVTITNFTTDDPTVTALLMPTVPPHSNEAGIAVPPHLSILAGLVTLTGDDHWWTTIDQRQFSSGTIAMNAVYSFTVWFQPDGSGTTNTATVRIRWNATDLTNEVTAFQVKAISAVTNPGVLAINSPCSGDIDGTDWPRFATWVPVSGVCTDTNVTWFSCRVLNSTRLVEWYRLASTGTNFSGRIELLNHYDNQIEVLGCNATGRGLYRSTVAHVRPSGPFPAGDAEDNDHDGRVNILERAMGTNPDVRDTEDAPLLEVTNGVAVFRYTHDTRQTNLSLFAEWSENGSGPWTRAGLLDRVELAGTRETRIAYLPQYDHGYFRLHAERVGPVDGDLGVPWWFSLRDVSVPRVTSSGASWSYTNLDQVLLRSSNATYQDDRQIYADVTAGIVGDGPFRWTLDNTNIATIGTTNATVTHLNGSTGGVVTVTATTDHLIRTRRLSLARRSGQVADAFTGYRAGTAANSITNGIDARLASHGTNISLWSSLGGTNWTANTNGWFAGLDFSCVPVQESAWNQLHLGILVSPRHLLLAAHYFWGTNVTVRFQGTNGAQQTAVVIRFTNVVSDIGIALLSTNITVATAARVFPTNFATWFPTGLGGLPAVGMSQFREASIHDMALWTTNTTLAYFQTPTSSLRLPFYRNAVQYDSGSAAFALVNNQPVAICTWWYGGAGAGPFITTFYDKVNAAMTNWPGLNVTNQLSPVDLSGFTSF